MKLIVQRFAKLQEPSLFAAEFSLSRTSPLENVTFRFFIFGKVTDNATANQQRNRKRTVSNLRSTQLQTKKHNPDRSKIATTITFFETWFENVIQFEK